MWLYIIKRLLLIFPTLLGILLINFIIIQFSPGGPIENIINSLNHGHNHNDRVNVGSEIIEESKIINDDSNELIKELNKIYGFDKHWTERLYEMIIDYLQFDFGNSFYRDESVISIILEKMPVSISLGLWTTLIIYMVSIPLGIKKAINNGNKFDIISSYIITITYAIPSFIFAMMLITFFAGGEYFSIFPNKGIVSDNWDSLNLVDKIKDYIWHMILPVTAMIVNGFASLTILCKNSFIDEIGKQYVITARAKGLKENKILYRHVFRNAMLIIIAGFPATFIGVFFTGSFLIEILFSLDGLGLLGYNAIINRDYPVIFTTLYLFTLMGLVLNLIGDIMYVIIDPRINFDGNN